MGRRKPFRQQVSEEFDSLINNDVVKHDLERLRKVFNMGYLDFPYYFILLFSLH